MVIVCLEVVKHRLFGWQLDATNAQREDLLIDSILFNQLVHQEVTIEFCIPIIGIGAAKADNSLNVERPDSSIHPADIDHAHIFSAYLTDLLTIVLRLIDLLVKEEGVESLEEVVEPSVVRLLL